MVNVLLCRIVRMISLAIHKANLTDILRSCNQFVLESRSQTMTLTAFEIFIFLIHPTSGADRRGGRGVAADPGGGGT